MKKTFFNLSALAGLALLLTGCPPKEVVIVPTPVPEKQYVVYSPGENLTSLTEVTKSDETCYTPFGGDKGRNLFFVVQDKSGTYSNIFHRKDNPISAAMSQLTGGKNANMSPTFCAATNQVAFAGRQSGATMRDIYLMNLSQGSALTQLTNTPDAEESYPCLSRDGSTLVYQKRGRGRAEYETEIWMKKLRTGEDIMLTTGCMPSFSPDGRTIVFVRHTSDAKNTCLWTMTTDGGNQAQLTNSTLGTVWHPRYSPSGTQIVFDCYKSEANNVDLYVIDSSGSAPTQLTINESYDGQPYWADDGNIYFTSDRGGRDKHYQIWRFQYSKGPVPPLVDYHTVLPGEKISQIASRYGVTVNNLVKWNNLQTMTLTPGMKLKIRE